MITIFSNESILYRGPDDNIRPVLLTANARPGQRFLVAVRIVGGDQIQSEFVQSTLTIEPPRNRPDPGFLRMESIRRPRRHWRLRTRKNRAGATT